MIDMKLLSFCFQVTLPNMKCHISVHDRSMLVTESVCDVESVLFSKREFYETKTKQTFSRSRCANIVRA